MAESELAMKLLKEPVSGVFNLCDVLQLVFDRCMLSQQDSVCYAHQGILHVVLHFGYQLYAAREKIFEQCLTDISFVCTELSLYIFQKPGLFQRFTVIHISGREHEIEYFSLVIDNQVQFETEEPPHETFNVPQDLQRLCESIYVGYGYTQQGGIHETNPSTSTQQDFLDENGQL